MKTAISGRKTIRLQNGVSTPWQDPKMLTKSEIQSQSLRGSTCPLWSSRWSPTINSNNFQRSKSTWTKPTWTTCLGGAICCRFESRLRKITRTKLVLCHPWDLIKDAGKFMLGTIGKRLERLTERFSSARMSAAAHIIQRNSIRLEKDWLFWN